MNRGVLIVCGLATAAIGGGAWWYLFSVGEVPVGRCGRVRRGVIAQRPAEFAEAQRLQALLME